MSSENSSGGKRKQIRIDVSDVNNDEKGSGNDVVEITRVEVTVISNTENENSGENSGENCRVGSNGGNRGRYSP